MLVTRIVQAMMFMVIAGIAIVDLGRGERLECW